MSEFIDLKEKIKNLENKNQLLEEALIETQKIFLDYFTDEEKKFKKKNGAVQVVKNHLSYRWGRVIFLRQSNMDNILLPIRLFYEYILFKYSIKRKGIILPLDRYDDYEEAKKILNSDFYIQGKKFIDILKLK